MDLLLAYPLLLVLVATHEAGHLLVASALDRPVLRVEVGRYWLCRVGTWRGIALYWGVAPLWGGVEVLARSRYVWKNVATYGAGPAVNIISAVALYSVGWNECATAALIVGVGNLIPFEGSDGAAILAEMRRPCLQNKALL